MFYEKYYSCASFAIFNPSWYGKIGGFGAIESVVVSSVISVRKSDHELARFLCDFVVWNLIVTQYLR
jgi:hypothetical protein